MIIRVRIIPIDTHIDSIKMSYVYENKLKCI